jgi:hypothetical protein
MSPAARAIRVAGFAIAVAFVLYLISATLDRWPEVVLAAWGAALGAGMAINGIMFREAEFASSFDASADPPHDSAGAAQHQICTLLASIAAWRTAATEAVAWALAAAILIVAWAWSLQRLTQNIEAASSRTFSGAYFRAFRVAALTLAAAGIYASIATESSWLWKPAVPADLQLPVWLAILEFASLPLTLIARISTPGTLGTEATPGTLK